MSRDQRTRLNADLAHNYGTGGQRKKGAATPGRSSLTGENLEAEVDAPEGELEEQEAAAPEEQVAERESKKSIFELPRKEPSRQPLLSSTIPPAAPSPATPAAPATPPKGPRRG